MTIMANLDPMIISAKLPTYLRTLLQEHEQMSVVLAIKRNIQVSTKTPLNPPEIDGSYILSDDLELTGSPLEVDLDENRTLNNLVLSDRPTSWTAEEATYQPISLEEARNLINNMLEKKAATNKPVYCICDGADAKSTVILGAQQTNNQLMRILMYILPNCKNTDKICSLEFLKEEHLKSSRCSTMTSFVTTKRHSLFGYDLSNCNSFESSEFAEWVCIEVSYDLNESSKTILDLKAILQVVVGHHNSAVHSLWTELEIIQRFINILTNSAEVCADSAISDDYLESSEIISQLCEIIEAPVSAVQDETCVGSELDGSRDNIVDKLWSVLKQCKNLSDLSKCFGVLLAELVESPIKHFLPENNFIVALIRHLLDKKQTIPTLTSHQSLELLIDLGLEKVKCDLVSIINKSYSIPQDFVQKWNDLSILKQVAKTSARRTDFYLNSESSSVDLDSIKLKLSYLVKMYTFLEHLLLYKNNIHLSEEYQIKFSKFVWSKFMTNLTTNSLTRPVVELSEVVFSLDSTSGGIIELLTPSSWSIKMSSVINSSAVTTAFNFSYFPIFPSTKNDEPCENPIYVAKLVKLEEFI